MRRELPQNQRLGLTLSERSAKNLSQDRPVLIIISNSASVLKRFRQKKENFEVGERTLDFFPMREEWIRKLESYLEGQDFGKNWDGAYQDAVPTLRNFFDKQGFRTRIMPEWISKSRDTELVAEKEKLVVRIPWAQDYNGRSVVDLTAIQVEH